MRVIAGSRKGRALQSLTGDHTRPTTDKVKETMFNMMGPSSFQGGLGLDLYAGTGALGIEALSRGLDRVIFVDHHPRAIKVIHNNLSTLDLSDRSEVFRNEAMRSLKALRKRNLTFEVIFLDPPYAKQNVEAVLAEIHEAQLLYRTGAVIVETDQDTFLPDSVGTIGKEKEKKMGQTKIAIYKHEWHGDGT